MRQLRQDGDARNARDPWFMGVTLALGPSGEVYVSDWSDTGECHSTRNTRKQTKGPQP